VQARTSTVRPPIFPVLVFHADFTALRKAYKFLDPNAYGGKVAAYVFGVLVGECIIFSIVWGLVKLRNKIFAKRRTAILTDVSPKEKVQTDQV